MLAAFCDTEMEHRMLHWAGLTGAGTFWAGTAPAQVLECGEAVPPTMSQETQRWPMLDGHLGSGRRTLSWAFLPSCLPCAHGGTGRAWP